MKFILFVFINLMFHLIGYCQVTWFPVGATWHYQYSSYPSGGLTTLEVLDEDTLIGSQTYKQILSTTVYGSPGSFDTLIETLFVFEENQVVYGYDPQWGGALLYDFNAGKGDTIEMYFGGLSYSPFVVDSIGEIDINGSLLTFQDIRFPSPFEPGEFGKIRVMEGLGAMYSHLFHSRTVLQPFDAPAYYFRCYEDENIGLVNLSFNQVDCDYIDGVTSIEENTKASSSVFPNPTNDIITVQYNDLSIDNFIIVDIVGSVRMAQRTSNPTHEQFDLNELEQGLYFILGMDKTGKVLFAEKITNLGN